MKWQFLPQPRNLVETGVTQRDQFRNDEVDLSDTIVRESIQNSLDAGRRDTQTRVIFRWVSSGDGLAPEFMKRLFEGQLAHARASALDVDDVSFDEPSALVIEDFGTRGLTGSVLEKDDDNFSDFWRRHGRSHKSGTARGRWGLGKLVYSSSSMLGAFFGVTVRAGDPNRYLMGQSVLDLHTLDGVEFPAHAFFSDMEGDEPSTQIQIPLADDELTEAFCHQFGLRRQAEAGLSIVIPFPNRDLSLETMLGVAIANYFYPIVTNQLVLEFDGQMITSSNIRELAHTYAASKISDIDELFDFVSEIYAMPDDALLPLKARWVDDEKLGENDFKEGELERLRDLFIDRQTVGIRLPLTLTLKNGEQLDTSFKVFLKRPEHLQKGHDLYVRGGLTLPAEAKFRDRKALGAMIAEDGPIASFLGDAENAAHTKWNGRAEKLRRNYRSPERRLRVIRNAVLNFYDLLAQAVEDHDEQALRQFFWTKRPESQGPRRPVGPTPPDIPPPPEPRPRPVRLDKTGDGFSIHPGSAAKDAVYPMTCSVRVAYDTANGNPFRRFDPLDFNFRSRAGPQVALTKETVNILEREPNSLTFRILQPKFALQVTGFDPNRDLHVILRILD